MRNRKTFGLRILLLGLFPLFGGCVDGFRLRVQGGIEGAVSGAIEAVVSSLVDPILNPPE